ncbi:MAG: flagellar protein FlaG [Spirochaetales bacterium]|nr:flagellar protein FlaG [Spirochaetales bacterium]
MELDVRNLSSIDTAVKDFYVVRENSTAQRAKAQAASEADEKIREKLATDSEVDAEKYLQDILNLTEYFNRKLKFSIDRELNKVIVKVVDSQTNRVIKEIPPEELLRLYSSLKRAIGVLVDEQI